MVLKVITLQCVPNVGTGARETHDVLKVTGESLREEEAGAPVLLLSSAATASFPRLGSARRCHSWVSGPGTEVGPKALHGGKQ